MSACRRPREGGCPESGDQTQRNQPEERARSDQQEPQQGGDPAAERRGAAGVEGVADIPEQLHADQQRQQEKRRSSAARRPPLRTTPLGRRAPVLTGGSRGESDGGCLESARIVAAREPGSELVADDAAGEAVRDHSLEAVADLDPRPAVVPRHQHQGAVVGLRLADLPRLRETQREVLDGAFDPGNAHQNQLDRCFGLEAGQEFLEPRLVGGGEQFRFVHHSPGQGRQRRLLPPGRAGGDEAECERSQGCAGAADQRLKSTAGAVSAPSSASK